MSDAAKGRILLSMTGFSPRRWFELLSAERDVVLKPERPDDPSIRYAVVWKHPPGVMAKLPNLEVIFSVGAGVDHIFADPQLPDVPVVRVVAENLTRHMVEYVVWRVMDHHRQGNTYRNQQRLRAWHEPPQPVSGDVTVGILGLGQLGRAAARQLLSIGFQVNGWSRTDRPMEGVATWHGQDGLQPFLAATDILVVLLPLTPATEGIVDYKLLKMLRPDGALGGPVLINAGRGKLHKEKDILAALEDGTLKEASLDVFETEPLPKTSPIWTHPSVFVTPHAAATSDANHLVPIMLEQIARHERGEKLENVVDREAGY
jgi:glyoxylate/hydroxypyruvate reductase A